ncbi:MAG: hypothetical protein MUC43_17485 [Pirellula sp.]|nr:hypothetical protein [Pirellula sp.]
MFHVSLLILSMANGHALPVGSIPIGMLIVLISISACSIPLNLAFYGIVVDPLLRSSSQPRLISWVLLASICAFSGYVGNQIFPRASDAGSVLVGLPFVIASVVAFASYVSFASPRGWPSKSLSWLGRKRSGLVLVAFLPALVGCDLPVGHKFLWAYDKLQFGMSKSDVQHLFGVKPAYHCMLGEYEIWYIRDSGFFTKDFPEEVREPGAKHQSASDLPDAFGYVQLAFDRDDNLFAFTWIGETFSVESVAGTAKGSHFKQLPRGTFD